MKFQSGHRLSFSIYSLFYTLFFFVLLININSCTHDPIITIDDHPVPSDTTNHANLTDTTIKPTPIDTGMLGICDSNEIYFNRDILPIFANSCAITGCHDSKSALEGYILTDYYNIIQRGFVSGKPDSSLIYKVVTVGNSRDFMPPEPYPKISTKQINQLKNWIATGLKQDSCIPKNGCDTTQLSFSKDILPRFEAKCTGRHGTIINYSGVRLHNYSNVKDALSTGRLLGSVRWESGYIKMPLDQPQLLGCEIKKLEIWVRNGALNN